MKKLVLIFTVILSTLNSYAQSQTTSTSKDADFSNFYVTSDVMTWQLTGIAHNETYSGLYFRIIVNNNKEGSFWFPKEIYISGAFGYLYPVGLTINGEEYETELIAQLKAESYFDGNEAEKKLQEAILQLPEKQRLVFNMKYFDDMKYEEMEEILGTSVGALKASYHHATKKIAHYLTESL